MSDFTRDFDTGKPVNHTLNNLWPLNVRSVLNDLYDRLGSIVSGFVSGQTVKGILKLPFIAVSKPATVTDQIQLYGKVVSDKTELHALDEDGNEIQITSDGKLKGGTGAEILAAVGPLIYPIGALYITAKNENPATTLGFGTWVAVCEARALCGYKSGDSNFGTVTGQVGEATHVLTADELPAHTHTCYQDCNGGGSSYGHTDWYAAAQKQSDTSFTGGGAAHNNIQPSETYYIWKRTV